MPFLLGKSVCSCCYLGNSRALKKISPPKKKKKMPLFPEDTACQHFNQVGICHSSGVPVPNIFLLSANSLSLIESFGPVQSSIGTAYAKAYDSRTDSTVVYVTCKLHATWVVSSDCPHRWPCHLEAATQHWQEVRLPPARVVGILLGREYLGGRGAEHGLGLAASFATNSNLCVVPHGRHSGE